MGMDVLTKVQRSHCMARVKGKNTKPEVIVRKIVRALGYSYRLDSKLIGRPDLKICGQKTLLFIDGCFWHACPDHFSAPKQNNLFWKKKIESNQNRDRLYGKILKARGYKVVRIWEHETKTPSKLEKKLQKLLG